MPENPNSININNNEYQINLDENLLGEFEIAILPQEGGSSQDDLGLEETSTKVNIEIKTNDPEDLLPKLKVLGFQVTNFSNANSFTGTIDRDSLTQIIPFANQVTFPGSPLDPSLGDNGGELGEVAVYTTGTVVTASTATASDSQAASLINLDDFQLDSRFAGIDGSGYSIVILDTGIDLNHQLFGPDNDRNGVADRIVYDYDFVNNDADASDVNGHGSHVSSIAAGIAPGANIIHLKVLDDNGSGSSFDIERALQWVVANGDTYNVASVNLSLGGGNVNSFTNVGLSDEYAALAAQDIVVSVASGNDFRNFNSVQGVNALSADPNVFSVGAVYDGNVGSFHYSSGARAFSTGADRITPFSQRHETLSTIFAPGAPIRGANANGGYSTKSGTSQAAPYVAGIIPLAQELAVREIGRRLTVAELRNLLVSTGVTINDGDDERDNVRNTGLDFKRVDVQALGEAILALGGGGSSLPNVSITSTPVTQQEGNSGTTSYVFTVTLDNASSEVVTVNYSTNDGTAIVANGDYIDNDGILTFNPGERSKTITVQVNGDTTFEANEQFTVALDSANNGIINSNANASTGIILNDDTPPPVIYIFPRSITQEEGDSGTTAYAFTVTLDNASSEVVTVNYSTNDGTATVANGDYIDNDGILTFNPGERSKTITVQVNGDTTVEGDETFFVNLNSASGATIATFQGIGTIENDDVSQVNGVAVNVNSATVTYSVESYGGFQDGNPTVTIDGSEVEIEGNGWKKLDLGGYNITDNTVLEFEFRSTAEGEIHGIGFDIDNNISSNFTFQLHGTQRWGINSFNDYITGEGWKSYQISVGDFLTGQARYLTLVNDHDVFNPTAISEFRNINLYENVGAASLSLNNEELVDPFSTGGSDILTSTVQSDFLF